MTLKHTLYALPRESVTWSLSDIPVIFADLFLTFFFFFFNLIIFICVCAVVHIRRSEGNLSSFSSSAMWAPWSNSGHSFQ